MKLTVRDLIASVLVGVIVATYVGSLLSGGLPFAGDAQHMAALGVVLGVVAFLMVRNEDYSARADRADLAETGLAAGSVVLGLLTLVFAQSAVAGLLLAAFMASILVVWAVDMLDQYGAVHWHGHPALATPVSAPDRLAPPERV